MQRSRDFCALGDIDPDAVVKHDPYVSEHREMFLKSSQEDIDSRCHYIWSSRAKDILVFSTVNPLKTEGCCNFFGIVGRADKLIPMYDVFHEKEWWEEEEEEILFIYRVRLPAGAEGGLVTGNYTCQAEVRFRYEGGSFFL